MFDSSPVAPGPSRRPVLAFEMAGLFADECRVWLTLFTPKQSVPSLLAESRGAFLAEEEGRESLWLAAYAQIVLQSCADGDGDWSEGEGYRPLVGGHWGSHLLEWGVRGALASARQAVGSDGPREMSGEDLLLRSYHLVSEDEEEWDDDPLVETLEGLCGTLQEIAGMLGDATQALSGAAADLSRAAESLAPAAPEAVPDPTPSRKRLFHTAKARTAPPAVPSLRRFLERPAEGPSARFSRLWLSPPPVTPAVLAPWKGLSETEQAFLLGLFVDVYDAEQSVLSLHLLLRRLVVLWRPGGIEAALCGGESDEVRRLMNHLTSHLSALFAIKFLGIEGVTLTGRKTVASLERLFPDAGALLDVRPFFESVIESVRDAAVMLDRLRCSLLYGPRHPSYAGDDFLTALLGSFHVLQHTEAGFQALMGVTNAFNALALPPEFSGEAVSFYESVLSRLPDRARQRGIERPREQRAYALHLSGLGDTPGLERESVPERGEIAPLHRVAGADGYRDLLYRMWGHAPDDTGGARP